MSDGESREFLFIHTKSCQKKPVKKKAKSTSSFAGGLRSRPGPCPHEKVVNLIHLFFNSIYFLFLDCIKFRTVITANAHARNIQMHGSFPIKQVEEMHSKIEDSEGKLTAYADSRRDSSLREGHASGTSDLNIFHFDKMQNQRK